MPRLLALLALASAAHAADAPKTGGFESRDVYRLQEVRDHGRDILIQLEADHSHAEMGTIRSRAKSAA